MGVLRLSHCTMRAAKKTRQEYEERDTRIRQMQEVGASNQEIALAFGISTDAVRLVFRKFEAQERASERGAKLLREFHSLDDLDRKWKVADVLDALLLTTRACTAIKNWCDWNHVTELSLREFMDLVVSEKPHARPGFLITPLLDFRNVRLHSFWSTVRRLTVTDLGNRCNEDWRRRLARLKHASRIVGGGYCSWSKACEYPDWLLKMATTP